MPRQAQYDARAEVHVPQYLRVVVEADTHPIPLAIQVRVIVIFGDAYLYRKEYRSLGQAWTCLLGEPAPDCQAFGDAFHAHAATGPIADAVRDALTKVWASEWPGAR